MGTINDGNNLPSKIKNIEAYSIVLLKQIYDALTDMGEERRNERYQDALPFDSIYEESLYMELKNFLEQRNELDNNQMLFLLTEAYKILEQGEQHNAWEEEEEKIYAMLEKIVQLGAKRRNIDTVFDQITEVTAAMAEGNFSKRIEHTKENKLSDQNLLNYIANAFNMLNEDLALTVIPKKQAIKHSIVQRIIHSAPTTWVVFVTDHEGKIDLVSDYACILYDLDKEKIADLNISEMIVGFNKIQQKILIEGGVQNCMIEFINARTKKKNAALLTASIAYADSGKIDGFVYRLNPVSMS